jgi:polyferredoxin
MKPLVVAIAAFIYATRRWGRIYCGWLCPHFGVVEWLNSLFVRAIGKPTLWEGKALPPEQSTTRNTKRDTEAHA